MSDGEYAETRGWARPATRGELRDKLAAGQACEVAAHVAEMTATMLRGWLDFDAFTVRPSDNDGWMLFEPNTGRTGPGARAAGDGYGAASGCAVGGTR